jgi:hypothetical protein
MSAKGQKRTFRLLFGMQADFLIARSGRHQAERATSTRGCAYSTRFQLAHNLNGWIATGSGGHVYLGMTIVRLTPATAFKETVRGGDLTQDNTAGQIAAWINYAAPELAQV